MNPAIGPFAIAAMLLVVGGVFKALHPHDTALALRGVGIAAGERTVRVGGVAEVVLGAAALLATDAVLAALVAVSYAMFVGFVAMALAKGLPIASCGCFGKADTPPSFVHLGVNIGACVAAVGVALDPDISPVEVVVEHLPESLLYVALVAVGVLASFVALTLLPRTLALIRGSRSAMSSSMPLR